MSKNKLKLKNSVKKRFKIKNGKVYRWDKKRKKPVLVTGAMARKVKKLLGEA
jgi:hypothetical protein